MLIILVVVPVLVFGARDGFFDSDLEDEIYESETVNSTFPVERSSSQHAAHSNSSARGPGVSSFSVQGSDIQNSSVNGQGRPSGHPPGEPRPIQQLSGSADTPTTSREITSEVSWSAAPSNQDLKSSWSEMYNSLRREMYKKPPQTSGRAAPSTLDFDVQRNEAVQKTSPDTSSLAFIRSAITSFHGAHAHALKSNNRTLFVLVFLIALVFFAIYFYYTGSSRDMEQLASSNSQRAKRPSVRFTAKPIFAEFEDSDGDADEEEEEPAGWRQRGRAPTGGPAVAGSETMRSTKSFCPDPRLTILMEASNTEEMEGADTTPSGESEESEENATTTAAHTKERTFTHLDSPLGMDCRVTMGGTDTVHDSPLGMDCLVAFSANIGDTPSRSAFLTDSAFGMGMEHSRSSWSSDLDSTRKPGADERHEADEKLSSTGGSG